MNSLLFYSLIYLIGIIISSFAQLLLKKASMIKYDNKIKEYLNLKTIIAYIVFFSATLLSVYSFKGLPLMYGTVIGATEYIFVTLLGYFVLKEQIKLKTIIGLLFVIIGVIIFFI